MISGSSPLSSPQRISPQTVIENISGGEKRWRVKKNHDEACSERPCCQLGIYWVVVNGEGVSHARLYLPLLLSRKKLMGNSNLEHR